MKLLKKRKVKILLGVLISVAFGVVIWQTFFSENANRFCFPKECHTYYCNKSLEHCDNENSFGIVSRYCSGKTKYKIKGKIVSKEKFYSEIKERNESCGNCIVKRGLGCL